MNSNQPKKRSIHAKALYRMRHLVPTLAIFTYFLASALHSGNMVAVKAFGVAIFSFLLLGTLVSYLCESNR